MASLTSALDDSENPVSQWMRQTFPNPRPLLAEIRRAAGTTVLHAPKGIAYTTQGGAIDWWLRFLASPPVNSPHRSHGHWNAPSS